MKDRKSKIEFLKGIRAGTRSIDELKIVYDPIIFDNDADDPLRIKSNNANVLM